MMRIVLWCWVLLLSVSACSNASLYGRSGEDNSADRLGLTGRVCTDDPRKAGFPVKVVYLVDTAIGPLFATFDPESLRLGVLNETVQLHGGNKDFGFSVLAFGANSRVMGPTDGSWFTRNPGELENAIALLGLPQPCIQGLCRDYDDGIDLARAIIEGDLADSTAGERGRSQYVVVMMAAGPPNPMALDWTETTDLLTEAVTELREDVEAAGALSFSMHVLQLAARDDASPDPQGDLDNTEGMLQLMALAGQGRFERFNTPDAISLDRIGLLKLTSLLEAKTLLVTNANVLPDAGKAAPDSDGDGLTDAQEVELGTLPDVADSDADGIGDRIEDLLSLDPLVRDDPAPNACVPLNGPPYGDADTDRLNDCEELLIGTDGSLPDTDGDAIPDWIEVTLGTDYLRADGLEDNDFDGSPNGDETLAHTDPRSGDANSHLADAYRYELDDEGFVVEPSVSDPRYLSTISVLDAGLETSGGLGTLRYQSGDIPSLSWQDPSDDQPGPTTPILQKGILTLDAFSAATGLDRWIQVSVDPLLLPPNPGEESLLVELSERQCLNYTVRNIKLLETQGSGGSGLNSIFVYFAEAPLGQLTRPGLFRVAHVPVVYHEATGRVPSAPLITVNDEEFAPIGN